MSAWNPPGVCLCLCVSFSVSGVCVSVCLCVCVCLCVSVCFGQHLLMRTLGNSYQLANTEQSQGCILCAKSSVPPDGITWHVSILCLCWDLTSFSEVTICTYGRDTSSGCTTMLGYMLLLDSLWFLCSYAMTTAQVCPGNVVACSCYFCPFPFLEDLVTHAGQQKDRCVCVCVHARTRACTCVSTYVCMCVWWHSCSRQLCMMGLDLNKSLLLLGISLQLLNGNPLVPDHSQ